mgnify:CR=1 FL=1
MFLFSFSNAQSLKPIAQKIQNLQKSGDNFAKFDLFSQDFSKQKVEKYSKAAKDISVMRLNKSEIKNIVSQKPENMEITFPFEGETLTVQLVKTNIFAENFKVNTDKGEVEYSPGVYYQGIVKGDNTSLVAFSFFENDVVGISSITNIGNVVLGKAKNSEDFVSYSDFKLNGQNPFICGFDEIAENQKQKVSFTPKNGKSDKKTSNCVRVYYEACFAPYQNNGSNVANTVNWITAVHNNIGTLYNNDDVKTAVSEVYVWTSADPYTSGYSQNLAAFRNNRPTFNGDLAHLVNSPSTTSVAYLNSLCGTYKYAYSGISHTYQNVPTYSWTIGAMTHEMGHSLGSPHTHACAWNGNDTAIDGCGPAANYGEGCDAPLPTKGTIMSYCHLIGSIGINLNLGFGPQPAELIRNTVESKGCLGSNCTTSCAITVTGLVSSAITNNSVNLAITDNVSTNWKYRVMNYSGAIVNYGTTSVKNFTINGLSEGTYYKILVGTDCSGTEAFQRETQILTDANWCNGAVAFTDTGGATGNYQNNQSIIKTFYPSSPGQKLLMTFTDFDIEPRDSSTNELYDFMTIYNGPGVSSPVFANGNQLNGNTVPGPFQSTHSSGAITVRFVSDGGLALGGWNANFSCITLDTKENDAKETVSITPNPTKGIIVINSSDKIISYEISDMSGRLVSKSANNVAAKSHTVDLSKKAVGTYLVTVKTEKETITKKIIKH